MADEVTVKTEIKPAATPQAKEPEKKPVEKTPEQTPEKKPEPKPEVKPEQQPEQKPEPKQETPVDNTKLGQVTSLLEKAGLSMQEVAKYAKENDGAIDLNSMVALKDEHGEAIAGLIADQIKGIHKEQLDKANARDQAVFDQVKEAFQGVTEQSGEETWKELSGWAKDNVSNEHRQEINGLLQQGGLAAKLAVQELVTAFKESQGAAEAQDAQLLDGDSTAPHDAGSISKAEYNKELNALLAKGHQYGSSKEIAKLDARRMKSIQRGH